MVKISTFTIFAESFEKDFFSFTFLPKNSAFVINGKLTGTRDYKSNTPGNFIKRQSCQRFLKLIFDSKILPRG